MLNLALIRENPDIVRQALAARQTEAPLDDVLALDDQRRRLLQQVETLRAERNAAGKEIGRLSQAAEQAGRQVLPREKDFSSVEEQDQSASAAREQADSIARRDELLERMRGVSQQIEELEDELRGVDERLNDLLLQLPNIPDPKVPLGASEEDNVLLRTEGEPRAFDFEPLPHWELGERLGIIDFERGAKLSGSRFYVLQGAGARLQRALIAWMLDLHIQKHGYTEFYLPFMVREACMWGAGQLPKLRDNMYHDAEEDFWLVPTAEVPLTNLHRDEILEPGALPRRLRGLHSLLPAREDERRPRRARHQARPPVRQGGDVQVRRARALRGRAAVAAGQRRGRLPRPGHPLSRRAALHRRPGLHVPNVVRRGDVGARLRRVAGGELLLQLRRLPGTAGQRPLPAREGGAAGIRPHPERLRPGPAANAHRRAGELPAGRRLGRRAGRPAPVHGWSGGHRETDEGLPARKRMQPERGSTSSSRLAAASHASARRSEYGGVCIRDERALHGGLRAAEISSAVPQAARANTTSLRRAIGTLAGQ